MVIATRPRRRFQSAAASGVLVLGLALAACGAEENDDDGVASAGGDATETDEAGSAEGMDDRDRMLAFTECLREQGFDVEDPVEGEGIRLEFNADTPRSEVDAAMEACREFAPEGGPGGGPADSETMIEFAECMRDNGVEAFPDPDPDEGGLMIGPEISEDPDFEAAQSACEEILGDLGRRSGS